MSDINSENKKKNSRSQDYTSDFSRDMKPNAEDVKALQNRGTNKADFGASFSRRNDEEKVKTKRSRTSDLEEKEGLEEKKENKEKSKDNKKNNNFSVGDIAKQTIIAKSPIGKLKAKILKLKITLIIIGIVASAMLIFMMIFFYISAWETFLNGVSTYFGIPEISTEENMTDPDGLFDNYEYMINPDTGEYYSMDELVMMFKEDGTCTKVTFWNKIGDWFDGLDGYFGDPCSYLRYIETEITKLEKTYDGLMMDRALIISTIFYGYGTQANYSQYIDTEGIGDVLSGSEHYKTLVDLLKDGKITTDDLDKIIINTVANTTFTYYTWSIEDVYNKDTNTTKKIGFCHAKEVEDVKYSLLKWKIFMRFGGEKYKDYDKTVAEIWEQEMSYKKQWDATSEECNGTIPLGQLAGLVDELDASVGIAHKELEHGEIPDIELFEQAATTTGTQKDIFKDYIREKGQNPVHIVFDYKDGFTYNDFPRYKESMNDSNIRLEYDEATTPKEIENNIEYMVEKKTVLNTILLFVDQDDPMRYRGSYDGYSSVITGAYCGDMLTAPVDDIMVKVTDCDGNLINIVDMENYITGVAYREVSHADDDYVKAQMLASISYALNRRSNYAKGTLITMKSGNCDQAYCDMSKGCKSQTSNLDCGGFKCTSYVPGEPKETPAASSSLIATYQSYYNEVKDLLVIDKTTGKVANTSYVSTAQNSWREKALAGMNYTQILQEHYGENFEIVQCSTYEMDSHEIQTTEVEEVGNGITPDYKMIAPDKGKFYGYSYNDKTKQEIEINPVWVNANITTVNSNCASANWNKDYQVNTQAVDNYKKAFKNICDILTNGVTLSNGITCNYTINDLQGGETFAQRKSINGVPNDISYGIVQDWNYYKEYVINGKTYKPYSNERNVEEYNEFVKALGNEEHCKNINYILYKYAYKNAGFMWDGSSKNASTFNPMHFYVKY